MTRAGELLRVVVFGSALLIAWPSASLACSLIKVTKDGTTIIGNNEEQMNPNTRIWFETGKNGGYGAVYVGFDNLYPQGGMNVKGLVFDGFGQSFRAVKTSANKKTLGPRELEKKVMQECATISEVKSLLEQYNLDTWSDSSLLFVDRTGAYLYVSGDEIIPGQEAYFVQTNRRPGETKACWRFDKAAAALASSATATLDNCRSIMEMIHQEREKNRVDTLYTTIYELAKPTVHLFYFYNFKEEVVFDLERELAKGDHVLNMPDLFHDNEPGRIYHTEYNKVLTLIRNLGAPEMKDTEKGAAELVKAVDDSFIWSGAFTYKIYHQAQFYLNEQVDYKRAILLLKTNVALAPKNGNAYADLANAYMMDKQLLLARESFGHALEQNPDNAVARERLAAVEKLLADQGQVPAAPGSEKRKD
jgi:hypothetical protein